MKWYFALNGASIQFDDMYEKCVRVAMLSALQNTSLEPCFLFDGAPCPLTDWVQRIGGSVIFHRSSLSDAILRANPSEPHWQNIARGAYLRIDIPFIEMESEFILYTDCDVLFLNDPAIESIRPTFFAVAPEFTRGDYYNMNSGVMIMNLQGMRSVSEELSNFIRDGMATFQAFDQGALRLFFHDRFDRLPEGLNWKPYWGHNSIASIVHFHGPKPPHARMLLSGVGQQLPSVYKDLFAVDTANYARLDVLWHAYLARSLLLI